MRLHRSSGLDGRLAAAALALAGPTAFETVDGQGEPWLERDAAPPLHGLVAILEHAQDLGGPLRPEGLERYRSAEAVNALLTEVLAPARLAAELGAASPRGGAARAAVGRQLQGLAAHLSPGGFLTGRRPLAADLVLVSVAAELARSGVAPTLPPALRSVAQAAIQAFGLVIDPHT